MSHDRGCFCGKERYEYDDCRDPTCHKRDKRMEQINTEHVNDRQVGGSHYRSQYQHWDWVIDLNIPYVIGCATKYILRWKRKGGAEDVQKAIHYIEKYLDSGMKNGLNTELYLRDGCASTHRFLHANQVDREESLIIWGVLTLVFQGTSEEWTSSLKGRLEDLFQTAQRAAGAGGGARLG